ncbi:hypothetical protein I5Q34_23465 [Streptomyces sp. AV19]|uniref:hypothetical protein n=1 Tax=Streptomyces sp. AV19 TaxID=2793068 RepID=UPI0018FEA2B1|nr:hypothetical protein [Streptomyces sp. AV19]MBH1937189.1 hypothetical protein [Streptomyces sp. AV19]MDG4533462.1 hypothetical protein [Streptomyces sp. AV19]
MTTRRTFLGTSAALGTAAFVGGSAARASAGATSAPVSEQDARAAVIQVDTDMQHHYDLLRASVARHLGPAIVVNNDAKGGEYFLVDQGKTIERLHPVGPLFELAKSIAHTPLGIYAVVAPYLDPKVPPVGNADRIDSHDLAQVAHIGPSSTAWSGPLQQFAVTLRTARQNLAGANLPAPLEDSSRSILDGGLDYITDAVASRSFDMQGFQDFSSAVYDHIRTTMYWASKAQIEGVHALLKRWRAQLGDARWSELYVLVFELWTTAALNQNAIIIKPCMDQKRAESHLINQMIAQFPSDPVATALDNLARIIQDNVAAEMVFPTAPDVATALAGEEDLLAQDILKQLKGCPFHTTAKD